MKRMHSAAIVAIITIVIFVAVPHRAQAQWILLEDTAHQMVQ